MKAVFFDFDGVVADTMKYHASSWVEALKMFGMNLPDEVVYRNEGSPFKEIIVTLFNYFGLQPNQELAEKIVAQKEIFFKQMNKGKIYPDFLELIQKVKDKGFRTALVTGTSPDNLKQNLTYDIAKYFDVIITSADVKRGKPEPDCYLKAAELLKVSTNDCLVIENAPFGIRAAKGAKMECFALCTTLTKKYLDKADQVFISHRDLINFFEGTKNPKRTGLQAGN